MTLYRRKLDLCFICLILIILISGCNPTQENPELDSTAQNIVGETKTSATLEKLKAIEPTYHVYFDGETCTVDGPAELTTGEYLFVLHSDTELPANLWLGSLSSGFSFDDYLLWREENCGGQGSHCEGGDSPKTAWYNPKLQAKDGEDLEYKLYEIKMEKTYVTWVDLDSYYGWLCVPIEVSN